MFHGKFCLKNHRKPDKFNFHEHSGLIETYYEEFDGDCWWTLYTYKNLLSMFYSKTTKNS